jgi:hypothetical protein
VPESASEVTAAGIARLAGVGRAAVSNWRRRHPDFPKPVGGTEASPAFALADVERWLRAQGKLAEVPLRERVWQQLVDRPAGTPALIGAGCALLLVRDRPSVWRELTEHDDDRLAELLPTALEQVLTARFGDDRAHLFPTPAGAGGGTGRGTVPTSEAGRGAGGEAAPDGPAPSGTGPAGAPYAGLGPLLRSVGELAAALGPPETFEFLLGRFLDANRQYTPTPPGPAALMAALAGPGPGGSVLDPAAGAGALLRAVALADPGAVLHAQDLDPATTALAALRLALHTDGRVAARAGDTLRADAFPGLAADAVLCHPPFNERNWGHGELGYDPRWEYGFPARTESELAWVQHALARLRPGGTAVLLMPPAAASRRSGRRIRAGLLRRGALRAVVALPAGAAPPYGIPLHLWVLRRPGAGRTPSPELLLVDVSGHTAAGGGRDRLDWQAVQDAVLGAWRPYEKGGAPDVPGTCRSVPVIELLDDDVDLAPARHVPPADTGGDADQLARVRERLGDTLRLTAELTPAAPVVTRAAPWPTTTLGELARGGALTVLTGTVAAAPGSPRSDVLTEHDVLGGTGPTGALPDGDGGPADEPVTTAEGDVVVPVLGGGSVVRVIDGASAGSVLGRHLQLLRPDPEALDPWFVAGFLRGTANTRQASSYASTASRLDVRRLQLPRVPLADQRRYGERFRALAAFEDALRLAGRLGEQLVQGLYDGLTDGTVQPEGTARPGTAGRAENTAPPGRDAP